MLRGRRRASVTRDEIEDGRNAVKYAMLFGKRTTLGQRNPCALVFAITTLDLLMNTLLHFSFQNSSPCWFVKAGDFQDVSCIDPIVRSTSHDMVIANLEFIDGHLQKDGQLVRWGTKERVVTLL